MTVLVTDAGGNHALAVVRSLGRRGCRVAAADSERFAKSFFSRFCAESAVYSSPFQGIAEFHRSLGRVVERVGPAMLMPMTERVILALLADPDGIGRRVTLAPLPSREALQVSFDKHATIELAKARGLPVPRTLSFCRLPDFETVRLQVSYPAVIKPRRSAIVTGDGRIVPGGPPAYCFGPEELAAKYLAVHQRAPLPLIQEFIPGQGYGVATLYDRGRLRALFAYRRLRMIQPTGSGSSLRESIAPPPVMAEAARSLLETLQWHGVAMVEFKLDSRDGTPKLMEINGRFWNSLPLAIAAGVDFPFLLYTLGTKGEVPDCFEYRTGVKARWLSADTKQLLEAFRGRPAGWTDEFPSRWQSFRDFVKFVGPDLHYDDLWLSDPLPFFAEIWDAVWSRIAGSGPRHAKPDAPGIPNA